MFCIRERPFIFRGDEAYIVTPSKQIDKYLVFRHEQCMCTNLRKRNKSDILSCFSFLLQAEFALFYFACLLIFFCYYALFLLLFFVDCFFFYYYIQIYCVNNNNTNLN